MATAMRRLVLACAAIACLTAALAAPAGAYSGLPPKEDGIFGADGTFRKTGTEVGKPAQTVAVFGTYRIVDDEIFGQENCPSTGLNRIQGLLPGATVAGSVVQYNWASKAVPRVQLANRAFKCGGEVRVELELYAQVDRIPTAICKGPFGLRLPCKYETTSKCEFSVFQLCPIHVTGEIRLYEGTSDTTDKLRKRQAVDINMVGGSFLPPLPGGKALDQAFFLKASAGDSVSMNLSFSVQPTLVLQG